MTDRAGGWIHPQAREYGTKPPSFAAGSQTRGDGSGTATRNSAIARERLSQSGRPRFYLARRIHASRKAHPTKPWTTHIGSRSAVRASPLGPVLILVAGTLAVGCGDNDDDSRGDSGSVDSRKCEQAAKILKDCDLEAEDRGECDAEAQAEADCVIRYPEGVCSESFTSAESQKFFHCLAGT